MKLIPQKVLTMLNLNETESLCPVCFKRISANRAVEENTVYLTKNCSEHGFFRTKIWEGEESFTNWSKPKIPIVKRFKMVPEDRGCPFDCGLCPSHNQHTCSAVLDVTQRCNLKCPFCFAGSSEKGHDIDRGEIEKLLKKVFEISPDCNLQISGGEPTLREDLTFIIDSAVKTGFKFVQINTNGIRLAKSNELAKQLKRAGLSSVFLQFDGVDDNIYKKLRGVNLFDIKKKAVDNCMRNDLGVILVPTVVPGINDNSLGDIISFALDHAPYVRGVHFQPVSYFGRIDRIPDDSGRITIPEIIERLEKQTNGILKKSDFRPSSCEHSLCSFNTKYMIEEDGSLSPLLSDNCGSAIKAEKGSEMAKESVLRQWSAPDTSCLCNNENLDGLDRFLLRAKTHIFSVSGMAFQDVWNIDVERLKGCCIHSVSPDGRLIPFCAYNVTNIDGKGLYRR